MDESGNMTLWKIGMRNMRCVKSGGRCAMLAWAVFLLSGCAGMTDIDEAHDFMALYSQGDYLAAAGTLGGETALDYDEKNLLTSLQVGTALRAAGEYRTAQTAFDRAESELLWKSDEIASVDDLLSAGLTLVTNDLARPYQGNILDGILVNTFKAMNAVHLGDMDRARIELNRAEQRQANAVEQLAVKVRALGEGDPGEEEGRETYAREVDGALAEIRRPDSPVAKRLAAVEALGEYRGLRNPFTDWLHGVFRMAAGETNRASDLFRDAAVLDGRNNRHVLTDLLQAETAVGSLAEAPERVWIVHEDGTGPTLNEFRFEFPVPVPDGAVLVGIALPEFVEGTPAVGTLAIDADGRSHRTAPLLDVDRYAATEFRAGYDAMAGKAVASAVVRAVLQVAARKAAKEEGGTLFGAIVEVASIIGTSMLTRADTRTWLSLPKSIGIASLPRPSDDRLLITTSDGQAVYDDALPAGRFVLVTVKTVRRGTLPTVRVAAFGE